MSIMLENVSCALCGSQTTQTIYKKFDLSIGRCGQCGLIYANPRLPKAEVWLRYNPDYFWQEYLPSLGVRERKYNLEFFDARHAAMLNLIASYIQPPGRLLEVGAGAGFFMKAAERVGWDVAGIEVSEAGVQFAQNELGLNVKQEASENITFEKDSFDVVVMFDVIEHLFAPNLALNSIHRVLRSGGILVIITPNYNSISRLAIGIDWAVLSPAEHLYYFSETTLKKLLKQNKFKNAEFIRQYVGFGVFETMNPRYTHAPHTLRAKAYSALVTGLGPFVFRYIQARGQGDALLCVASAS